MIKNQIVKIKKRDLENLYEELRILREGSVLPAKYEGEPRVYMIEPLEQESLYNDNDPWKPDLLSTSIGIIVWVLFFVFAVWALSKLRAIGGIDEK